MRIGVLGTCQADSYGAAVRAFLPAAEVRCFALNACDVAEVYEWAANAALFLTEPVLDPAWGALCTARLPQDRLSLLPHVVFTGFHPDLVYVPAWEARHAPVGHYHSALVAACFCLDLPAARAPALFNRYVYEELGYFAEFDRARDFLVQSCAQLGYDAAEIAALVADWARRGSFMHTFDHPAAQVTMDLVRSNLARAGLIDAAAGATPPPDVLAGFRWPVHTCIAERHGIAAEPNFSLCGEVETVVRFAERSYAAYRDADRAELAAAAAIAETVATLQRIGLR